MLALTTLLFTSALVGLASSQSNYTFDPTAIPLSTKNQWCLSESNNCPVLCGGDSYTSANSCDGATLTYNCTCTNGSAPDLAAYTGTLPFLICQAASGQCIASRPNDATGQTACTNEFVCGTLNPANVTGPSSSTSSSSSATPTPTSTSATAATATSSASATATAKSSLAISIGQDYGLGLLITALFATMGLVL